MQGVDFVLLLSLPPLGFHWTKAYLWTGGFLYSILRVGYLNHKYLAQMGKNTDKKMRNGVLLITQSNPGVKPQQFPKAQIHFLLI